MERSRPTNDLTAAVPKLCLELETFRRSADGRTRTSAEFLTSFFDATAEGPEGDGVFRFLPRDVRGPILSGWGIRGAKAAIRDDDAKVWAVVRDALAAGDLDAAAFEEGLEAETVVKWLPLPAWWEFWREGKLTKKSIGKALETAYGFGLFDARWFLDRLEARDGKLHGTDVLAEGLTKADLTSWVRAIHASGDGSPRGVVQALGWETIVTQTSNEVLVGVLDAMARSVGLTAMAETDAVPAASTIADDAGPFEATKTPVPPRAPTSEPRPETAAYPGLSGRDSESIPISTEDPVSEADVTARGTVPPPSLVSGDDDDEDDEELEATAVFQVTDGALEERGEPEQS